MLRAGTDDDVTACVELWAASVAARDDEPVSDAVRARAAEKFRAPRVAVVVDDEGDGALGGFALVTAPGTGMPGDPPDAAYVSMLAVDPRRQGDGVGRALLTAAIDAARAAGHPRCLLHALEDNERALRLYRSVGFRPLGEPFPHALSGRPSRAHVV